MGERACSRCRRGASSAAVAMCGVARRRMLLPQNRRTFWKGGMRKDHAKSKWLLSPARARRDWPRTLSLSRSAGICAFNAGQGFTTRTAVEGFRTRILLPRKVVLTAPHLLPVCACDFLDTQSLATSGLSETITWSCTPPQDHHLSLSTNTLPWESTGRVVAE